MATATRRLPPSMPSRGSESPRSFIEAQALMRLVDKRIGERRQFRLAQVDELLFGNKIIDE